MAKASGNRERRLTEYIEGNASTEITNNFKNGVSEKLEKCVLRVRKKKILRRCLDFISIYFAPFLY